MKADEPLISARDIPSQKPFCSRLSRSMSAFGDFASTEDILHSIQLARDGPGTADDSVNAAFYVLICGRPVADTDAHGSSALPDSASAPACPILLNGSDGCQSLLGHTKRHEHLIENNLVEDFEAGGAEPVAEAAGLPAIALDHFG